jgi:hypothetical protein
MTHEAPLRPLRGRSLRKLQARLRKAGQPEQADEAARQEEVLRAYLRNGQTDAAMERELQKYRAAQELFLRTQD